MNGGLMQLLLYNFKRDPLDKMEKLIKNEETQSDSIHKTRLIYLSDEIIQESMFYGMLVKEVISDIACSNQKCNLCLKKYQDNDKLKIFKCNHYLHETCSNNWINDKCPTCTFKKGITYMVEI